MDPKLSAIIRKFEKTCIERCTNSTNNDLYEAGRAEVMAFPELRAHLPDWLIRCRTGGQFWDLMSAQSGKWAERRKFIRDSLNPVHDWIESRAPAVHGSVSLMIEAVSSETISGAWQKILARKEADPAGAITAARSMVESTCKHILEEMKVEYDNGADLQKLYKLTARCLKLGVDQHDEQIFKQILTGCFSAVDGLAGLRNRHGDAHGPSKKSLRAAPRHADLAANLAGTMSTFLIATHEARKANPPADVPPGS